MDRQNDKVYFLDQSKLKIIKSRPFIYWISDAFREKFGNKSLEDVADVVGGITSEITSDFSGFGGKSILVISQLTTILTRKNGLGTQKVVHTINGMGIFGCRLNWKNDGKEIVDSPKSVMRNKEYYFREGITYSASGSKGASFRYLAKEFYL